MTATADDAYEISEDDPNQDIAETVMWSAREGKPLDVTLDDGRTVRLVPQTTA